MVGFKPNFKSKIRPEKCSFSGLNVPPGHSRGGDEDRSLLTLNKIQLRQEFQLSGDVQLKVPERRVGVQGEILEVVDGFAQPGASEGEGKGC